MNGHKFFGGMNFEQAIEEFHRLMEATKVAEGNIPNHHAPWVDDHKHQGKDSFSYKYAIERRNKIAERDGHLTESVPFLNWFVLRGNNADQYLLAENPKATYQKGIITDTVVRSPESLADVLDSLLGIALQQELAQMILAIEEQESFVSSMKVTTKDVTKIGGYSELTDNLGNALAVMQEQSEMIVRQARGNARTVSVILIQDWGALHFPVYGKAQFVPDKNVDVSLALA